MSDSILDRLAEKSTVGKDSFGGVRIPTIKLDGSASGDTAGHILRFDGDVMTDLGKSLDLQIIRIRKKLLLGGEDIKFYSNEYDSPTNDKVFLYQVSKDGGSWGKPIVIAEGTATELRTIKAVKVASVVYGINSSNELVKLTVKGASTTGDDGLYDYESSFNRDLFQYITQVSVSKVDKNRAISYHRMHFKKGDKLTSGFEKVEQYLDLIAGITTQVKTTENKKEDTNDW